MDPADDGGGDTGGRQFGPRAFLENTGTLSGLSMTVGDNGSPDTSKEPVISLPKGGGALRGIGEKFQANPVTGTASLAVPIAVTPGRSGFGPSLSLSYDSGGGNGAFGLGWSLSLPLIGRRTDKGLPRYRDDLDIFILSGAEDLVPMLAKNATQESPARTQDGYIIRRYCPRIEGLFARIEKWTSTTDATDVFWRSITPDNITTFYGRDASSRVVNPSDPSHIYQWLICASYDKRGNALLYEYKEEDSAAVLLDTSNEQNRTTASRSANKYPKRIRYGNRFPGRPTIVTNDADWLFEVVFDYGEHDADDPTPNDPGTWLCRQDPFSVYRSTFEIRTYRLCRRVLTFHRIPEELGEAVTLIRSTSFQYNESHSLSFLSTVTQSGHVRPSASNPSHGSAYVTKSIPPTEFEYTSIPTPGVLSNLQARPVDPKYLENLPQGVDGDGYRWVDLTGEGLPSVLSETTGSWLYKQNTSSLNIISDPAKADGKRTDASFALTETLREKPSHLSLSSGKALFLDVQGQGVVDLVQLDGQPRGFYPRLAGKMNRQRNKENNKWAIFRNFEKWPNIDIQDPSIRMVDVTGDGIADLLQADDTTFTWYQSLGGDGFGFANVSYADEKQGARGSFSDPDQCFLMEDMTGDGLADLVEVRNGSICYWPNLGYGRFGLKVVMDNCPLLDSDEGFNPQRVRFADVDGSGNADLLYLTPRGVRMYLNNSGNSWQDGQELVLFPYVFDHATVNIIDLLGMGTSCIVWSSPLPSDSASPIQYFDFMDGRKPHLLSRVMNNLGAETRIQYAPSTYFSLKDAEAGRPWKTRLPFPVHCVKRTESIDRVGRTRFIKRLAYHNGCYDGFEREFRGFSCVEQWDAEEYFTSPEDLGNPETTTLVNLDKTSLAPPVHSKMWFHSGIYIDEPELRYDTASEFYGAPDPKDPAFAAFLTTMLPDSTTSPVAASLTGGEVREAYRALKGLPVRQEIYADDAKPGDDPAILARAAIPYSISESSYTVEVIQARGGNHHAVFFPHSLETLSRQLDRNPSDPRISHSLVLQIDNYGNTLRSCTVSYGRSLGLSLLPPEIAAKQEQIHVVYTEADYTKKVDADDDLVLPVPCTNRIYEVTGFQPAGARFNMAEFTTNNFGPLTGLVEIPFEQSSTPGIGQKRLIGSSRILFRMDDMASLLPLGQVESRALPGLSYKLVLTPGLLGLAFEQMKPDGTVVDLLPSPTSVLGGPGGAYVDLDNDGRWWISTGRMYFHPDPAATAAAELALAIDDFFLAKRTTDVFGNSGTVAYDSEKLLVVESVDALYNQTTCVNDYRVLSPRLLTDSNGNQAEVVFDALGMVVATAVMGKPGENLGDNIHSIQADLAQNDIDTFFSNPTGPMAKKLLGGSSSRIVYDIGKFYREPLVGKKEPIVLALITRESHVSDGALNDQLKIYVTLSYSDGYERQIQTKGQVEPGPLTDTGPSVDPRWVCTGWTIYNNKGLPVRQYEPFFDDTHQFKFDETMGVTTIILYDPIERPVATIHPDHSWSKIVITPWNQHLYDSNDTVLMDPKADPDIGRYASLLADSDCYPTWYQDRISGGQGPGHQDAATKAAAQANTPNISYVDSMGRVCFHVSDNGSSGKYESQSVLDIQSNQLEAIDAQGRTIGRYVFDMLGSCLHSSSIEGGERWLLINGAGSPLFTWNSRGFRSHYTYDQLQRPLETLMLADGATSEIVMHRVVYGDSLPLPDPKTLNQRQQPVQIYDQAGITTSAAYDFKGNLLGMSRQFASNYKTALDWKSGSQPMESQIYSSSQTLDALNRVVTMTTHDGTTTRMTFDASAAVKTVSANLPGERDPSGQLMWTSFVTDIEYDAKGQRQSITYNNDTKRTFTYDRQTYRLVRIQTSQISTPNAFQDLNYFHDPSGNITRIRDDAQQTIYFRGQKVEPSADYTYDALYRLIRATGREHLGQTNGAPNAPSPPVAFDRIHTRLDHPGDSNAMGTYVETYTYDSVGNILSLAHVGSQPSQPGWTRTYSYEEPSQLEPSSGDIYNNRLTSTTIGSVTEDYKYDGEGGLHGLMTSMPQLTGMQWNSQDQLRSTTSQKVNDPNIVPETTYYVYDASGQRVRKVTQRQGIGVPMKETLYIGHCETRRKFDSTGTTISLERGTFHVMDEAGRVALVETRTVGTDKSPQQLIRYQYSNHIGSACLELDDQTRVVSYEEFYPLGSSSYQATNKITQVPKRYRFTGKERDKESGLDYRGSRYYMPWLGRWISADPGALIDGPNLYWYARCNPVTFSDPSGYKADDPNIEILDRGNFGQRMSQSQVRLAYAEYENLYYTGDATWNETAKSWTVDENHLISVEEASSMNYWGDASPASKPSTPEKSPETPGKAGGGDEDGQSLVKSFAYGLVRGAATGLVVGAAFGAVIATGGTAGLLLGAIGLGMMGLQATEIIVGKDLSGKALSANERAEKAGELVGGIVGGGIGGKIGSQLKAGTAVASEAADAIASEAGPTGGSAAPAEPTGGSAAADAPPDAADLTAAEPPPQPAEAVLGQRVADNPAINRVWNSVAKPNAEGTARALYRNQWRRFWTAVRQPQNADAANVFTDAGFEFPQGSRNTAPFHPRVGNNRFGRLSLDHMTRLLDHGQPTDPNNLMWMIQGDNTNIQNLSVKDPIDWGSVSMSLQRTGRLAGVLLETEW